MSRIEVELKFHVGDRAFIINEMKIYECQIEEVNICMSDQGNDVHYKILIPGPCHQMASASDLYESQEKIFEELRTNTIKINPANTDWDNHL